MSVLFSEYLIEKNILNSNQVLEILIEQLQKIPSTAELVYECNLLPKNDLLKILMHQQNAGSDFQTSANALGLWNSDLANNILEILKSRNNPISELIVNKGYLSTDALSNAILSFTENQSEVLASEKPNNNENKLISSSILKEYLDCFENNIRPNIIAIISKLKTENLPADNSLIELKNVKAEFVAAQAAANFVGATLSESVSLETSNYLEKIISSKENMNYINSIEIIECALNILDIIYNSLKKNNYEDKQDENMTNLLNRFKEWTQQNL